MLPSSPCPPRRSAPFSVRRPIALAAVATAVVVAIAACTPSARQPQQATRQPSPGGAPAAAAAVGLNDAAGRLPTGARLDPTGQSYDVGSMPLAAVVSPEGDHVILLLGGWREQGLQVVDLYTGEVLQTLQQPAAFAGLAFAPDGRSIYASGGNQDVIYRYSWRDGTASLADSLVLAPRAPRSNGTRYPAGLAVSPDGRFLFAAENLADSLAVVEVATGRVVQRLPTERYPYGVVVRGGVGGDLTVYVSAWGGNSVSVFTAEPQEGTAPPRLVERTRLRVGRHPSALLLTANGSRLFVASGSTDRVSVVDTRLGRVVAELNDAPPGRGAAGSTPNALALSADGARLYVAEADNNAVAVFDLSARTANVPVARVEEDRLAGRVPVGWYPTALATSGDRLYVANGKGRGAAGPAPGGPQPPAGAASARGAALPRTSGTLTTIAGADGLTTADLDSLARRVARANGWDAPRSRGRSGYPPITNVVYIIKEGRTFDQLFGDLPGADGDSTLLAFPRSVTPNHHALAERFGVYDRFFVNAEAGGDGHGWTAAGYVTDYTQKTLPSHHSGRGRTYDYEGLNRGRIPAEEGADDVAEPANGYLWDLAQRAGISFRNFGEFVVREEGPPGTIPGARRYRGTKPSLAAHTNSRYPPFDPTIRDQQRADVWIDELRSFVEAGSMPALQIVRLPNDRASGGEPGAPTPRAQTADNDLALGRMIEALTRTPFWRSTVVFVLEDDTQYGADHVGPHRAPLLVISPYSRRGVFHRFTNTTDVIATVADLLGLGSLSQFDYYGRPLRDVWTSRPDTTFYTASVPAVDLNERNPAR